jgi:hypothetical protein
MNGYTEKAVKRNCGPPKWDAIESGMYGIHLLRHHGLQFMFASEDEPSNLNC